MSPDEGERADCRRSEASRGGPCCGVWVRVRSPPARAACWPRAAQASRARRAASATNTITIGYIAPFTGSLSGFASGDKFVINTIRATKAYANGFTVGGRNYERQHRGRRQPVGSQPGLGPGPPAHPQQQRRPAADLVHPGDGQPGRGGGPDRGRAVRGHQRPVGVLVRRAGRRPGQPHHDVRSTARCSSSGSRSSQGCFVPMWNRIPASSKNVACQYPNDADGNAFRAGSCRSSCSMRATTRSTAAPTPTAPPTSPR